MRIRKHNAFTLAELLVIMAVLAILMAAFAPMFTSRYTNIATDSVWSSVPGDNSIYSDAPNKLLLQQSFIGITPESAEDAKLNYTPSSKLIIRSRNSQKQIEFKFNNDAQGELFAANGNLLFGGPYNSVNPDTAKNNTAFGRGALGSLTTGENNTALGFEALNKLTTGSNNTAIGNSTAAMLASVKNNTIVGYNAYTANSGDNNTIIGQNLKNHNSQVSDAVAVGNETDISGGNYNIAIGHGASAKGSGYNTAVGANSKTATGQYNTSIGYNSCNTLLNEKTGSKITCIGVSDDTVNGTNLENVLNSNNSNSSHVYIGQSTKDGPSLLEVHSQQRANSTVIVNGDLIVRGQPYLTDSEGKLMSFALHSMGGLKSYSHYPLMGFDGSEYNTRLKDTSGVYHQKYEQLSGCICASDRTVYAWSEAKCCPQITSDARLKNIGTFYDDGFEKLNKLKIYNYSYKNESKKHTRVGVIAQDLKKVFPNAVKKDEQGYYRIRWDEMFYAAINAVKTLYSKAENLISKIEQDKAKIKALKEDNKRLEQKLEELSQEIAKLEK